MSVESKQSVCTQKYRDLIAVRVKKTGQPLCCYGFPVPMRYISIEDFCGWAPSFPTKILMSCAVNLPIFKVIGVFVL